MAQNLPGCPGSQPFSQGAPFSWEYGTWDQVSIPNTTVCVSAPFLSLVSVKWSPWQLTTSPRSHLLLVCLLQSHLFLHPQHRSGGLATHLLPDDPLAFSFPSKPQQRLFHMLLAQLTHLHVFEATCSQASWPISPLQLLLLMSFSSPGTSGTICQ